MKINVTQANVVGYLVQIFNQDGDGESSVDTLEFQEMYEEDTVPSEIVLQAGQYLRIDPVEPE